MMEERKLNQLVEKLSLSSDLFQENIDRLSQKINVLNEETIPKYEQQLNELVDVVVPAKPAPDKVKNIASATFGITAVLAVLMFLFHCIIWVLKFLFNISWDTWAWTVNIALWGAGISLVITVIVAWKHGKDVKNYETKVKEKEEYEKQKDSINYHLAESESQLNSLIERIESFLRDRYDVLEHALRTKLAMPYPIGKMEEEDYYSIKDCYFRMLQLQKEIEEAKTTNIPLWIQKRKEFADSKILFLYKYSIKKEVPDNVYKEFNKQLERGKKNIMLLRGEISELGRGVKNINEVDLYKRLLIENKMEPLLQKFEITQQRDTSGFLFFTNTDKKAQQTRDMQALVVAARDEYEELNKINEKIQYALGYVRGCAYRNIYLGAELLNYIKEGRQSGGKLTTEKDSIDINNVTTSDIEIDTSAAKADISGNIINDVGGLISTALDNKEMLNFAKANPKVAMGAVAVTAITSAAIEYFSKLSQNANMQAEMTKNISIMSEGYNSGQAQALRAIEIIKAIVNANNGFMAIYEPMRKTVYEDKNLANITMKDIQQLAQATQEYQKISKSKING